MQEASYNVFYLVAKLISFLCLKNHLLDQDVQKLSAPIWVQWSTGNKKVLFWGYTVRRCMDDVLDDRETSLSEKIIKSNRFVLQTDGHRCQ